MAPIVNSTAQYMVNWTNVNNASAFLNTANDATGGIFWSAMLWMFGIIMFLVMLPTGPGFSLIASCLTGFLVGMMMLYMGLITSWDLAPFIGIFFVTILWSMYSSNKG